MENVLWPRKCKDNDLPNGVKGIFHATITKRYQLRLDGICTLHRYIVIHAIVYKSVIRHFYVALCSIVMDYPEVN